MALEDLMSAPGTSGLSVAGEMGSEELVALQKALTAGYGSDTNGLTGGSAFRIQSQNTRTRRTVTPDAPSGHVVVVAVRCESQQHNKAPPRA